MNYCPATPLKPARDLTKGRAGCTRMEMEEGQISNQTHYYKHLRLGNSWEVSGDPGGRCRQKTFRWIVRYVLGSLRMAVTRFRVSTSIWSALLYSEGSTSSLPAEPSPLSRRSRMAFNRVTVTSRFFANSSSLASLPRVPLPALMSVISWLAFAMVWLALS